MEQRCVSFDVAKAIKDAGYPQDNSEYLYNIDGTFASKLDYESWGISTWDKIAKPTYFEVWLWLWREKKVNIQILSPEYMIFMRDRTIGGCSDIEDPEESIIAAIEYLVDNDLIK